MKHALLKLTHLFLLAAVALLGAGCGSEGRAPTLAEELFGTWDLISIDVEGSSTDCPGEVLLGGEEPVSCGTEYRTLSSDGTFVQIETTDELGNPFDYRYEGRWATGASILTLNYLREGPDENNLDPISPSKTFIGTWSLSGTTLTVSISILEPPFSPVLSTLEKR